MEPQEMSTLVVESERAWQALGTVSYGPTEAEQKSLIYRRSLYVVKDMNAGEMFTQENVRAIRPGYGLPPKYLSQIIGRRAVRAMKRGTAISWNLIG
jgi:N-acetylneuraminate synthase